MAETVESEELRQMVCPRCGGPVEAGYVAGHWFNMRWVRDEKTKTVFAGRPLRKKIDWWNAPSLEAIRCHTCKMGIFRFDY